jgi:hypothetical protein
MGPQQVTDNRATFAFVVKSVNFGSQWRMRRKDVLTMWDRASVKAPKRPCGYLCVTRYAFNSVSQEFVLAAEASKYCAASSRQSLTTG